MSLLELEWLTRLPKVAFVGSGMWGKWWLGWWPERLAAAVAMAGVLWSVVDNFHVRGWEATGSDFKTLYASAWCLARGLDAYSFGNLARVFTWGGVVEPQTWFGHAPVYPPFTLALLAPLTLLPMWVAVYAWVLLSGLALTCAAAALARFAGEAFGLGRLWRMTILVGVVASPLGSFGLALGNVSVVTVSLCVLAVARPEGARLWPRALGLSVALLLKPHIAVWVLVALLLVPSGRALGRAACAFGVGLAGVLYLVAAARAGWGAEFAGYFAMLHVETAGGSMRAANHELMEAAAQIVSLNSLLGYAGATAMRGLGVAVLAGMAGALVWASLRLRGQVGRLQAVAAWSALGLIATYHRAADGTMLLVMLPWLASRWQRRWWDGWAWAALAAYAALSIGPDFPTLLAMRDHLRFGTVEEFLLYRQGALAAVIVAGVLGWGLVRLGARSSRAAQ